MPSEVGGSPSVAPRRLCRKKPYWLAPAEVRASGLLGDHAAHDDLLASLPLAGDANGGAVGGVGHGALHLADGADGAAP